LGRIQGRAKRRQVYERFDYACAHCGKRFQPARDGLAPSVEYRDERGKPRVCVLEVDHIVPRIAGGTSDIENLQALCTQCNARKGHKLP
jgi:5-methylcytosine-specific restriction endonuclease McrA